MFHASVNVAVSGVHASASPLRLRAINVVLVVTMAWPRAAKGDGGLRRDNAISRFYVFMFAYAPSHSSQHGSGLFRLHAGHIDQPYEGDRRRWGRGGGVLTGGGDKALMRPFRRAQTADCDAWLMVVRGGRSLSDTTTAAEQFRFTVPSLASGK